MSEFWKLVGMFLFGAGGLAIIDLIKDRWKWRAERKAIKEDRAEEKEDKLDQLGKKFDEYAQRQDEFNQQTNARFADMEKNDAAQSEALKYVLLDRILYIGQSYIKHGEVSFDDRKRLREMYEVYHKPRSEGGLGGNGDAKFVMDAVDKLPLKQ